MRQSRAHLPECGKASVVYFALGQTFGTGWWVSRWPGWWVGLVSMGAAPGDTDSVGMCRDLTTFLQEGV